MGVAVRRIVDIADGRPEASITDARSVIGTAQAGPSAGAPFALEPSRTEALSQTGTNRMHHPMMSAARIRLMGADLDPVTPAQVLNFIARRVERGHKAIVGNHNMHSLSLKQCHAGMAAFFREADLIQIDSVPLILWGKFLGQPVTRDHRSTYLDWRDQFWPLASERGWRVFLLGSAPGIAEKMAEKLQLLWPGLTVAGHNGYFDHRPGSEDNRAVVAEINAFQPDVVMVGMGMPLQENWIHDNFGALERGVYLSVGGAFDYEVGVQIPAPRWIGKLGLEWLFRFACQPRRLFHRYFVEPWSLTGAALNDLSQKARRPRKAGSTPVSDRLSL